MHTDPLLLMDAVDEREVACLPVGEVFRARFGNPYPVSHRADVHLSLLEGVRECSAIEVLTAAHVARVEELGAVVAVDRDGQRHRGAALIGCDGVKSAVRAQYVGDEARVSG